MPNPPRVETEALIAVVEGQPERLASLLEVMSGEELRVFYRHIAELQMVILRHPKLLDD